MRIFMLILSLIAAAACVFLNVLGYNGTLSQVEFILISAAVEILLCLLLGHFMFRTYANRKRAKTQAQELTTPRPHCSWRRTKPLRPRKPLPQPPLRVTPPKPAPKPLRPKPTPSLRCRKRALTPPCLRHQSAPRIPSPSTPPAQPPTTISARQPSTPHPLCERT